MDSFFSTSKDIFNETVIERSRFITHVFYVENEQDARVKLEQIRKKYSDATHNCYAYITDYGTTTKCSDDGEPSGTAGMPIMEVLKNKKLVNTLVVVTRYFGGIKLGAGGLVRAYSNGATLALQNAGVKEFFLCNLVEVSLQYDQYNIFLRDIIPTCTATVSTTYNEDIKVLLLVKKSAYKSFIDTFKSVFYNKEPQIIGERFY